LYTQIPKKGIERQTLVAEYLPSNPIKGIESKFSKIDYESHKGN